MPDAGFSKKQNPFFLRRNGFFCAIRISNAFKWQIVPSSFLISLMNFKYSKIKLMLKF